MAFSSPPWHSVGARRRRGRALGGPPVTQPPTLGARFRVEVESLDWKGLGHAMFALWRFLAPWLVRWRMWAIEHLTAPTANAPREVQAQYRRELAAADQYGRVLEQMGEALRVMRERGSFPTTELHLALGISDMLMRTLYGGRGAEELEIVVEAFERNRDPIAARAMVAAHVLLTISSLMDEGEGDSSNPHANIEFLRERVWTCYFRAAMGIQAMHCSRFDLLTPFVTGAYEDELPSLEVNGVMLEGYALADYLTHRDLLAEAERNPTCDPEFGWRELWRVYEESRPFRGTVAGLRR